MLNDLGYFGIELLDVHLLPLVLRLHVRRDGQVEAFFLDLLKRHDHRTVRHVLPVAIKLEDVIDILVRESILIAVLDELVFAVDEEHGVVVRLVLLEDKNRDGNRVVAEE